MESAVPGKSRSDDSSAAPATGSSNGDRASRIVLVTVLFAAVALVVLAVHWPALSASAVTLDDGPYLIDNYLVQNPSWTGARRFLTEVLAPSTVPGYYQPLGMISLMLDSAMGGRVDNLRPYHRTSLLLHVLNVILLMLLVYGLFGSPVAAAAVGLLFGAHPIAADSIPWVTDRKTLLSVLFALGCLNLHVRYARTARRGYLVAAVALFILAVLSKPTVAVLPLMLLVLDWWPLNRLGRRAIVEKAAFFVIGAVSAAITMACEAGETGGLFYNEHGPEAFLLVFCHNTVFYLHNTVYPASLSIWYAFPEKLGLSDSWIRAGVIGTAVFAVLVAISLRWTRALAAGALFFVIGFLPTVAAVVRVGDMIAANRFIYLPMVGLLLIAGFVLARFFNGVSRGPAEGARYVVVAAVVVALFGLETVWTRRCLARWQDSVTLHEHIVRLAPQSPKAHNVLGAVLNESGRTGEAVARFEEALRLDPGFAEAHYNLGTVLASQGRFEEAAARYVEAVRLKPDYVAAYVNLGNVRAAMGKLQEAFADYGRALKLKPDDPSVHYNIAGTLVALGDLEAAVGHYQAALRSRPDDPETHNNLGVILSRLGEHGLAIAHYRAALRIAPNSPGVLRNLAWVLAASGDAACRDPAEATRLAERARQIIGDDPAVLDTLAVAYAAAGRFDEAVRTAQEAIGRARTAGQPQLAESIRDRLQLYAARIPYREAGRPLP